MVDTDWFARGWHLPEAELQRIEAARELAAFEQQGEFRFLLFAQSMTVRLHIEHQPLRVAEAKAGNGCNKKNSQRSGHGWEVHNISKF